MSNFTSLLLAGVAFGSLAGSRNGARSGSPGTGQLLPGGCAGLDPATYSSTDHQPREEYHPLHRRRHGYPLDHRRPYLRGSVARRRRQSNNSTIDTFPFSALVKTYTPDAQVANSAPTASP